MRNLFFCWTNTSSLTMRRPTSRHIAQYYTLACIHRQTKRFLFVYSISRCSQCSVPVMDGWMRLRTHLSISPCGMLLVSHFLIWDSSPIASTTTVPPVFNAMHNHSRSTRIFHHKIAAWAACVVMFMFYFHMHTQRKHLSIYMHS